MSALADISEAYREWAGVVGEGNVSRGEPELGAAATATFATTQCVLAVVRPATREEVRECVRIAARLRAPLYPVSAGRNWGYGSRVPVADGSVILSLERLDRIVDFDERLAYLTVEPGVTFAQAQDFLRARRSRLTLNGPGSTPRASIVGNALERGIAGGLSGERVHEICDLEVVLPDGRLLQTGAGRFDGARAARVTRHAAGPSLDGLFSQSNLGIVTRLTHWLTPLPRFFQYFTFQLGRERGLGPLLDALQALKREGLIETTCGLYNGHKVLSYCRQFPWELTGGRTPLPEELLRGLLEPLGGGTWYGEAAITAQSAELGELKREWVRRALDGLSDGLSFAEANAANPLVGPSPETGLSSVYWRKREPPPPPSAQDPDADGCGLIWCVFIAPFTSEAVGTGLRLMEASMRAFQFEPLLGVQCMTMRAVYLVASIIYDRRQEGEDAAAQACELEMLRAMAREGFYPYRLNVRTMGVLRSPGSDYAGLVQSIKEAFDPADILACGRYDFRHEWSD